MESKITEQVERAYTIEQIIAAALRAEIRNPDIDELERELLSTPNTEQGGLSAEDTIVKLFPFESYGKHDDKDEMDAVDSINRIRKAERSAYIKGHDDGAMKCEDSIYKHLKLWEGEANNPITALISDKIKEFASTEQGGLRWVKASEPPKETDDYFCELRHENDLPGDKPTKAEVKFFVDDNKWNLGEGWSVIRYITESAEQGKGVQTIEDWEQREQKAWHWLLKQGTVYSGQQYGDCFKVVDVIYALKFAAKGTNLSTPQKVEGVEEAAEALHDTVNQIVCDRLEELEIHKWWDYGTFEEIRDKGATAEGITEDILKVFAQWQADKGNSQSK